MKKTVIAGIITGILVVAPAFWQASAQDRASGQVSAGASIGAKGLPSGLGTFSMTRGSPTATIDNLRKAAAGGCREKVNVIALVDDSLSTSRLARYGWRIVTRIGEVATLSGCAETVPYLCALPGIRYIKMPSRVHPTMDSVRKIVHVNEVHKTIPGWTGPRLTGKGVLFGIIDTDFDTRHKAFLDSNGLTRFVALWDQDSVAGFPDGIKKNHQELLADSMFGLDTFSTHYWRGHGTPMAGFAAGSDWASPYYGVAPDVVIAGVKMREDDAHYIDGLGWLFSIADSLGLPCVVNMSLGSPEGPHDGTSLVDRAIDNVSATPGHIVVGASGNDGNFKEHIYLQMASGQSKGTWAVPFVSSWYGAGMEMWGDSGKALTATFNVLNTGTYYIGEPAPRKRLDSRTSVPDAGLQMVSWTDNISHTTYTLLFQITAVERASALNGKPHLQAVMYTPDPMLYWGASIAVPGAAGGSVHAWNFAQKPFAGFGVANYYDGDSLISVNEIGGTAKRNITVGAYYSKLSYALWGGRWSPYVDDSGYHTLTLYSGRGPTVDGRVKPDITAPGSNVAGAVPRYFTDKSNLVYWPDSPAVEGRYAVNGGTSVSSPIVAGVVALMLEIDPTLTVEEVRTYLQATAINDSATGKIISPNNLWGAGKVNALGVVDKMINGTAVGPPPKVPLREASSTYGLIRLPGNRLKFIGSAKGVTIELFSLSGRRLLWQTSLHSAGSTVVSLAPLSQGVYFARAVEKGWVLCSKKISVLY